MRNNETGEFELVVGNRQLLSGFFIVVLLFAVAFAMGYVVGQNAPKTAKVQEAASSPAANSSVADSRPQPTARNSPPSPPPVETPAKPTDTSSAPPPATEAPPQTQPARDPNAPAPTPAAPPAAAPAPAADPAAEAPGTYWQVLATSNQAAANGMLLTLRKSGFPASLSPGPNNLTRVLVGPYSDKQRMAKAKTDLESAGFSAVRH